MEKAILVVTATFCAAAAMATETVAYSYDAMGRLARVVRSGTVNNSVSPNSPPQ